MKLSKLLLLLFIIVPLVEIYLFITIGQMIGVLPTVLLVILTAIVGTYLLRVQGLATLQKIQSTLEKGLMPTEALIEGILLILGGALLLTPGFFTDVVGFFCIVPILRTHLISWLKRYILLINQSASPKRPKQPSTIEGEYRREDD